MTAVYGDKPETILYTSTTGKKKTNHVLLGTWLKVVDSTDDWLKV